MRILYHHRTQAEDGQAVHVRSLIAAFEGLGHVVEEVGLVKHAARASGAGPGANGANGADAPNAPNTPAGAAASRSRWSWVVRLPRFARELAEYGYNGIAKQRLLRAALRFEPDFVYERYAFGNAAGVLATRNLKRPLVLEVNSPLVLELGRTRGLSFPRLAAQLEGFVFKTAERVCVVTGVLRDMLAEMGVAHERLLVTPNGVDLAAYDYPDRAAARRAARLDLGLAAEEAGPVLGFVGYYRTWHRLDLALRALAEPGLEDAWLVLIGAGPARAELEAAARSLGVEARVRFAGPRPHARIPALLPAFDVALVPAINPYASPLKLHEYMAAGLAVIAPDQPNLREVLTQRENALLVAPDDADALSAAVVELLRAPALRTRLAARARETVHERDLTWTGNARRVVGAVQELRR